MNSDKINNLFNIITNNHIETEKLGIAFSKLINNGDVIALNGDLGSGKTTFMKGVLTGLDYKSEVTSPTYTLINEYRAKFNVIHLDCYREQDLNRWLNIGLLDYFNDNNIIFIEWAEKINSILPNKKINLFFEVIDSNKRLIKYNE